MRYLLDSHTFLWFSDDAPELSPQAKSLIMDESVSIAVSNDLRRYQTQTHHPKNQTARTKNLENDDHNS
jgi:hypothetical protein